MNLHRVQKKGDKLLLQEYDRDRTAQYKKRKETLPKITSPAMMEICEVRYECPDDISPVSMEDFMNKNLDETNRYVSEQDIETNQDTMKMVIEECPNGYDEF